jgi:hypothetical protein
MSRRATNAPSASLKRAALYTSLFLAGLAVRGLFGAHSRAANEKSATRPVDAIHAGAVPIGPTRTANGIPIGFAHTEPGAVAAAVSDITTGQALLDLDPIGVDAAVRTMAATGAADAQVADTQAKLAAARQALADGNGPITYRQGVIAVRVDAYTPDRARIAAWSVGVLARAGVAPPQAGWSTSVLELVWERDDWKVWSETISPGPAPIPNDSAPPATAAQLQASLAGFTDLQAAI